MIIRKWQDKDNLKVSQIEEDCFKDFWTYQMIEDAFKSPTFLGYVAEEEGEVVGYIALTYCLDEGEINLIAVDKNFRRKNIATALMNFATSELKNLGVEKLFLEVRRSNLGAQALYEKLGFTFVGVRTKYYQGVEDALLMSKVIKE